MTAFGSVRDLRIDDSTGDNFKLLDYHVIHLMISEEPVVSVITPSYNRKDRILDAIRSVDAQTYDNLEHIIVDDASDTPVEEIVSRSQIDTSHELIIERHPVNRGAQAARNTGIESAIGEYIAFLDDDDRWYPTKIQRQVNKAVSTGAGMVYTGVEQKRDNRVFATQIPTIEGRITRELLSGTPIKSTSTILVKSDVFDQVGRFDTGLKNHQDWEFYIRASTVAEFRGVQEVLVTRHHHQDSQISSDYEGKLKESVPIMKEKHGDLARSYGVENQFYAVLESTLGATAIEAGNYQAARKHYLKSLKLSPSKVALIRLLALCGGGTSYRFSRRIKRSIANTISE